MGPRKLPRLHLPRIFDVRAGEGRVALLGFAALLLLIITTHTVLETARDALLLTGPGPRALGFVYMAIAGCTLPTAALAGRAGARFGAGRALVGTLVVSAIASAALFTVRRAELRPWLSTSGAASSPRSPCLSSGRSS